MFHKHTKKKVLLTAAVLSAVSIPAYAAERTENAAATRVHTDEIVVTASRTEQEVKETPSAVEVITRADIDKMGAETLAQALKLAIGIDIQENAMVGNRSAIRGMNTNQTLILVDGRRVRTENTIETMNYYELQRINMDDVERIEIVRGAVSSLYGSEALGGVINVIRKRPAKAQASLTLDWTTRQSDQGIRLDSGKIGKWAFSTSFKHMDVRQRGTNAGSNMYGKKYFFNIDGRMDVAQNKWLDVFFDYSCPHCAEFDSLHTDEISKLLDNGEATLVLHPCKILGQDWTDLAMNAMGLVIDKDPDNALAFHNAVFEEYLSIAQKQDPSRLTVETLVAVGEKAGVSGEVTTQFKDTITSRAYDAWTKLGTETFQNLGFKGTPTILVRGEQIDLTQVGAADSLTKLINK